MVMKFSGFARFELGVVMIVFAALVLLAPRPASSQIVVADGYELELKCPDIDPDVSKSGWIHCCPT